eukprot:COSAG02_NODE_1548_length_11970_cov_43.634235_9_plen_234_part_00
MLSGLIYKCLADQDADTNSIGATAVFGLVCAVNLMTVMYSAYVVVSTLMQSAKRKQLHPEREEQRETLVRLASKGGRLNRKALHELQVQHQWLEMVEKQRKYSQAEHAVEDAKLSLGRIAQILPEHAEDVQRELVAALDRFDEFLDIGREKCAHLLERYSTVDMVGVDELSAEAFAQLQTGPQLSRIETQLTTPPPPTYGQVNPRQTATMTQSVPSLTSSAVAAQDSPESINA